MASLSVPVDVTHSQERACAGIVLAMQPCPDKAVPVEQVRSMLAVFGPIAWSAALDPLPTDSPVPHGL